jgi:predicted MFS family arabinose efflux permease
MQSEPIAERPERIHPFGLSVLFGLLYFIQGISEPTEGLISQPVNALLKSWGQNTQQIAAFSALLALPWAVKPVYGLISDFLPLAGYHRKSYLIVVSAVASLSLGALYALDLPSSAVGTLFLLLASATTAVAFSDVVVDALMVEKGQPHGWTGRFQSVQWAAIYAAAILTGTLGGYLSQHSQQNLGFLICGATMFGTLLLSVGVISDRRARDFTDDFKSTFRLLRRAMASRTILAVGTFLFFWSFNPFSTTVLYMYTTESLKFSEQFYGNLTSLDAVGAMTGSLLYGFYCRRVPMAVLVHASIVMGILSTVAYWGLRDEASAEAISLAVGASRATAVLIQLDLAAQVCPPQTAGTLFALMMALSNLGTSLSRGLGGWWYEDWLHDWGNRAAFDALVGIGALFTAGCWLAVPFLKPILPQYAPSDVVEMKP